jgi:hypothetical protein
MFGARHDHLFGTRHEHSKDEQAVLALFGALRFGAAIVGSF